ncbi:hypothetical protein E4U53_002418 [Claviceps sorghi]|nr:hypothetical protein E4U53_002418 [Claviceps sorghi]
MLPLDSLGPEAPLLEIAKRQSYFSWLSDEVLPRMRQVRDAKVKVDFSSFVKCGKDTSDSPWSELCHVSQQPRWKKLAKLWQGDIQQSTNSALRRDSLLQENTVRTVLDDGFLTALSNFPFASMRPAQTIKLGNTCKGVSEMLELLQKHERSGIVSPKEAQLLRDEVLTAALTNNSWLNIVVDTAHWLLANYDFHWPNLYIKIMHHMLDNGRHEDAIRWHLRLAPKFLPSTDIFDAERRVAQAADSFIDDSFSELKRHDCSSKGQFSDSIVAKWFASCWISVDFAINVAQRLGLRELGPRSLQSLALREPGAKMLALRLARIEKLGITVSRTNYCKVLASFARHQDDLLLRDFLTCDIHPDEFDDVETRRMLMDSSVRSRDWRRQRLLQGIEWAIEAESSARRLNTLLQREVAAYKLGRARQVLDRMEAVKVNLDQKSASRLLTAAFRRIGKHSAKRKYRGSKSPTTPESLLNEAIGIVRRVALHNFAIPLRYWKLLLYNLGRSGRLDELQQLSEEIVQLYTPSSGGLVPICPEDLPRRSTMERTATNSFGDLSGLSVYGKSAKKDLSQVVESRSCANRRNFDSVTADGSRYLWDEAAGCTMVRCSPDLMTLEVSSEAIEPPAEACGNDDCLMLCIPADLSLGHQQHPVQQIFDLTLQRSIVRWAFDQQLNMFPACPSLENLSESGITVCDITHGVRLLARLRDLGVLVDSQVLRAVILSKIALGQVPGRKRNRSRDRHELLPERLKLLFDEAWGAELLPSTLEMRHQIDKQRPKLWDRYSKLFRQSFDKQLKSS